MDPALEEAIRRGPSDRELEAAALVVAGAAPPAELRVVATFGPEVVTGRVRVDRVAEVRRHPAIRSLKAARVVRPADAGTAAGRWTEPGPRPRGVAGATGAGCVLALLDWGCDFAHPHFLAGGRTRLRAIWDQRGPGDGNRWGYGRVLSRERIDAALRAPDPYAALGYAPGRAGAHGTHVMDIAAGGGGLAGAARGVAPEAELVFVHLSTGLRTGAGDLGDSVRILEALDFAREVAAGSPLVVNLSLGRTAGDHTGQSCVERGMDAFLEEAPARAIVQSAGNYFGKHLHAAGVLAPGRRHDLEWIVGPGDPTPNELELWYPGRDRLAVELTAPGGAARLRLELGQRAPIELGGEVVGFAYHRERDPLNGDHQLDVFLEPRAPAGTWQVRLVGADVVDGRWHAWIERDPGGPAAQSRFRGDVATDDATIGSIATARRTLVVGAIDARTDLPAPFSSSGPSRDGRGKPDLVAPGVGIVAARSTPPGAPAGSGGLLELSGTSMASPHVAGAVAALFGAAPRPLNIAETRLLLLGSARRLEGDPLRTGAGALDTEAALEALRCMLDRRQGVGRETGSETGPRAAWSEESAMECRSCSGRAARGSWSGVESGALEREVEEALGPVGGYDVVGWPGAALLAPIRAGDVLLRVDPRDPGRLLVARITAYGLLAPGTFPPGVEAEEEAEGGYAEAVARTSAGWGSTPTYRRVTDHRRVVTANQIVLRPAAPAGAPAALGPRAPGGVAAPPAPPAVPPGEEPGAEPVDEPLEEPAFSSPWEPLDAEAVPAFEVGAADDRAREYVELPVHQEDWIPNADGTGVVMMQFACRTPAELDAVLGAGTTGTAEDARFGFWRTAGGKLQAALDLLVYHPAVAAGDTALPAGRHPLVVVCMGNHNAHDGTHEIQSHKGYSASIDPHHAPQAAGPYLQEALARAGMVSVSVSTNPANHLSLFLETRARLVVAAIQRMQQLDRDPASRYHRHIDFTRVALVGHSRGGDAVARAVRLVPADVRVQAVVQLAPTDQTGLLQGRAPTLPAGSVGAPPAGAPAPTFATRPSTIPPGAGVRQLLIWGSRDGDVSGFGDVRSDLSVNPFRHYDRSATQRAFQFWHGATHNRFNRYWKDSEEDAFCLSRTGEAAGLMARADQEQRTIEMVRGWLTFSLFDDTAQAGLFDGRTPTAVATALPIAGMWKFGRRLVTIDEFDDLQPALNTLGGANVASATGVFDEVTLANENAAGAGVTAYQLPHLDRALRFSPAPPLAVEGQAVSITGPSSTAPPRWRTAIPPGSRDLRRFDVLTLRVTKRYAADLLAAGTAVRPTVRVRLVGPGSTAHVETALGRLSTVPIRRVIPKVPCFTRDLDLTKVHYETWEVDLAPYGAALLTDVRFVELELVTEVGQPVYVDTLSLVRRP